MAGYYLPEPEFSPLISEPSFEPSTGAAYSAAFGQSFIEAPVYSGLTALDIGLRESFGRKIDYASAKKRALDAGVELADDFYKDTTDSALGVRISLKKDEMRRDYVLSNMNSSTALAAGLFATGALAQFGDFANIASAYVPVAGLPAMTRAVRQGHSVAASAIRGKVAADAAIKGAGYGRRMAIGALEGSVGAAITEAAVYPLQQYAGADYTLTDSMLNISMGAPFGAVLHAAPKAFGDLRNRVTRQRTADAFTDNVRNDIMETFGGDEAIDVPAIAAARATNNKLADEMREFGMDDTMLAEAGLLDDAGAVRDNVSPVEIIDSATGAIQARREADAQAGKPVSQYDKAIAEAQKIKDRLTELESTKKAVRAETELKNLLGYPKPPESLSQFVRRTGGIEDTGGEFRSQDIKQFGKGAGLVKKSKNQKAQGTFLARVDNEQGIDAVKQRVFDAGYFPTKQQYNEISNDELRDAIMRDANERDAFKRIYDGDTTIKLADALASDKYRLIDQMDAIGISKDMSVEDIAGVMTQHNKDMDAIHAAPFEVRENAFTLANAQMLDGRPIDVQDVFDGDPISALQKMADDYYDAGDLDGFERMQERIAMMNPFYGDPINATDMDVAKAEQVANDIPFPLTNDKGGSTVDALSADVRKSFGKYTDKMMDESRITVVQSVKDLPDFTPDKFSEADGAIKGVKYPDGRVFIVADNVSPVEARGLVLHEVGVHVGMRNMLGDEKFAKLLDDVMSNTDDPRFERARKAVPEDTAPEHVAEEMLAYLVQDAPESNIVMRVLAAVRAYLYKVFGKQFLLDEYALRHMAVGSLRRVSKLGEPRTENMMFSKGADDAQTVIEGAEPISDKQLAERKMAQPLKATKAQKRMDEGLFAEPDKQLVMFSKGKKLEAPDPKALGKALKDELAPFNKAQAQAEMYPVAMRTALQYINDDAVLGAALEKGGVSQGMIELVSTEMKRAHRLTLNSLKREMKKIKTANIAENTGSEEDMRLIIAQEAIKEKIALAKRNAALNFAARESIKKHARQFGADFIHEGFLSRISGSAMMREGARDSAAAQVQTYLREWGNRVDVGLRKNGVKAQFTSRALDREIASAMERLDDAKPDFTGIPKDAVTIAKLLADINEEMRLTQNRFGGYIKYRKAFSVHQSYDIIKIAKTSREQFKKDAYESFDLKVMTDGRMENADKMLDEIYAELSTGKHEIDMAGTGTDYDFRTGKSIAKKVSMSRSIIFKRGEWYDFNLKYGTGDFATAYLKGVENAARATGLMKMLGTNPEFNINQALDEIANELKYTNPDAVRTLEKNKDKIFNNLMSVDGSTEIPTDITKAKIGTNIRLWQMMSKLGSSIASNPIDLANYAANVRYEGRGNMFSGMAEAVTALGQRNSDGVRRQVLDSLDVTLDHLQADMMQAFLKGNTFTHNMAAVGRVFTKLNFQRPWTTQLQKAQAIGLSHYLGSNSGKKYDALDDELKRLLTVHNITADKWELMRKASRRMDDGRTYLLTDLISELSDADISKYVQKRGINPTETSIRNARESIAASYRAMIVDRLDSAVVTGDKRAQAAATQGTQRGTVLGELVRTVMQFKSYPLTYWERIVKREVYGRGYDTMGDYMRNGKGDMLGMAGFLAMQMALGYASLTVKDAINNKGPRRLDKAGTWIEMFRQGGSAGLYGDILANEYDRNKGATLATVLAGPTVGAAGDLLDVMSAAARGDKYAVNLTRAVMANVPGANLIYVKPALNNLIMYQMYENMNPGFLRRMEQNAQKKGQEWLLRPSETLR